MADEDEDPQPPARMSEVGGKLLGSPGTQMKPKSGQKPPELPEDITARSWIVSDAESGKVLAASNAHWKLPPASTLKMLFADTVLPKFPKTKTHKVKASDLEGLGEGSSLVGVKEDQTYSVRDLWRGVFLRSGNDAVHVLAAMNGGKDKTVREMNEQAEKLRAGDTNVVSPDGYDKKGQVSSAYDLTLIARNGMQKADFREYASTARAQFPGEEKKGKKRETYEIQNTNRLLTGDIGLDPYPGIAGVKNGSTSEAGATFTGVAQRGDRVLLVTCMHPDGRQGGLEVYKETARLFDWGFKAADKVEPVGQLVAPAGIGSSGKSGDREDRGKAADRATGGSGEGGEGSGGAGFALAVTAGCLVLVAAVAYAVHRRWPIPELAKLRTLPFVHGTPPGPAGGSASVSLKDSASGSATGADSVAGSGGTDSPKSPDSPGQDGPSDSPGQDGPPGSDPVGARKPD
ncbi:D-alanyl-D-alanine carboxypeptidase (penicillin-binding protein 5/6) [Streptomyces sp. WMMB 322]|nr:D-alanyl-D-alanine carboxypeptidase (penicillin-binding protein 5/6) [Streptomyces sp. WMMB 322]